MGLLALRLGEKQPTSEEIQKEVDNILKKLLQVVEPEKVILFGSANSENFTYGSDIDLAIIFTDRDKLKSGKKCVLENGPYSDFSCDFLFYDTETFQKRATLGGICMGISSLGKIIYDKRADI